MIQVLGAPCRKGADDGIVQRGFVLHLAELAVMICFQLTSLLQSYDIPPALCVLKSTDIQDRLGQ